jgi:hypothetical protein
MTVTTPGVCPEPGFTASQFPPLTVLAPAVNAIPLTVLNTETLWLGGELVSSVRALKLRLVGDTVRLGSVVPA